MRIGGIEFVRSGEGLSPRGCPEFWFVARVVAVVLDVVDVVVSVNGQKIDFGILKVVRPRVDVAVVLVAAAQIDVQRVVCVQHRLQAQEAILEVNVNIPILVGNLLQMVQKHIAVLRNHTVSVHTQRHACFFLFSLLYLRLVRRFFERSTGKEKKEANL